MVDAYVGFWFHCSPDPGLIIDPLIDFTLTKPPRPADLEGRNFPVRGEPVKRPLADL